MHFDVRFWFDSDGNKHYAAFCYMPHHGFQTMRLVYDRPSYSPGGLDSVLITCAYSAEILHGTEEIPRDITVVLAQRGATYSTRRVARKRDLTDRNV